MTPQLEMLLTQRRVRTEHEVEQEYQTHLKMIETGQSPTKQSSSTAMHTKVKLDSPLRDEPKSSLLLLPSHIESMRQVFQDLDKHGDQILKRSDFTAKLRTSDKIVNFIDVDAVKTAAAKPRVLSLDEVIVEVEKDEMYEQMH